MRGITSRHPFFQSNILVPHLFLLSANLYRRFNLSVLGANYEEHPLVLRISLEERGIVLIILAFFDLGFATFAVVQSFDDKHGDGLCTIRPCLTGDSPIEVF